MLWKINFGVKERKNFVVGICQKWFLRAHLNFGIVGKCIFELGFLDMQPTLCSLVCLCVSDQYLTIKILRMKLINHEYFVTKKSFVI